MWKMMPEHTVTNVDDTVPTWTWGCSLVEWRCTHL